MLVSGNLQMRFLQCRPAKVRTCIWTWLQVQQICSSARDKRFKKVIVQIIVCADLSSDSVAMVVSSDSATRADGTSSREQWPNEYAASVRRFEEC
eukprot:6194196-Pleurochrysis_carterae.AAC.7